jgi:hypothetical protein
METVIARFRDPVSLSRYKDKIELRIGPRKRGETRTAWISASDARILAYALLRVAEEASADKGAKS